MEGCESIGPYLLILLLPRNVSLTTSDHIFLQIFTSLEWDSLILKSVLPKLGSLLRDTFEVRPSAQDMTALEYVLPWGGPDGVIKPTMFSQLLETEFFPKWLDVLFRWLTASKPNFDEVTQWSVQLSFLS
jgi:tuftelin-interacting protein 11